MNATDDTLCWLHFGDLHIRNSEDENYVDFLNLIEAANENLSSELDFVFLPGDNADDGTESQYRLVRKALDGLKLPVKIITGDHDRKGGTLDNFRHYLEPELYRAATIRHFRLLFLNAMDGPDQKTFDLGSEQFEWMSKELSQARSTGLRPLVFVHLYPSELKTRSNDFSRLIRECQVEIVEMGHTHYNELANDGRTVYATTRSTGQIEEGPPGFSITVIDGDVISWKFKPRGPWPFVMITSPADHRLITRPESRRHVVRGVTKIRARAWDGRGVETASCSVDGETARAMDLADDGFWEATWDSRPLEDGCHSVRVEVECAGETAFDEISVLVNQSGEYIEPARHAIDFQNALSEWPLKGILGTQLGPNENGTKGPWPSWRGQ